MPETILLLSLLGAGLAQETDFVVIELEKLLQEEMNLAADRLEIEAGVFGDIPSALATTIREVASEVLDVLDPSSLAGVTKLKDTLRRLYSGVRSS